MASRTPIALRLVAVLAGIHAAGFTLALLTTDPDGVVTLLGLCAVVSAAASSHALWRLRGWAVRALLAWGFAAPLFGVTLFASLYPHRLGSSAWHTVLEGSAMWLLFMGAAAWEVRKAVRGRPAPGP